MNWQPGASVATAQLRAAMLQRLRARFDDQQVMEVQTPGLCRYAVTDVHIDCLSASAPLLDRQFFLRTSPEYALKRLLAAGYPDVYEIGPVYRDGECGARHEPEFTMLEWYRHEFDLDAIIDDTLQVLQTALLPLSDSGWLQPTADTRRYDDWLLAATHCDSDSDMQTLQGKLAEDFPADLSSDRQAVLDWLFDRQVTAIMPRNQFCVVTHYPAAQAALARLDATGERALRFEVYFNGLELANGFVELADAREQRARFTNDQAVRAAQSRFAPHIDEPFIAALTAGLPDCAGVAIGVDRLVMLLSGCDHIRDVVSFTSTQG
ncbi:MAG: EF-P lysine aminoacylase EpmA [Pseudomonadota bacterium]